MKIVRRAAELPRYLSSRVALVPTMGALHDGHLSLIRAAREECDKVIVSLFVNPLQFAAHEDLAKYPRDEDRDAELAKQAGAELLFAPTVNEMYPRESTTIHVPVVTSLWEGAIRPGHFDGVATVVSKLFHMVLPDVSYFGLKDLQQCQVVRRMAEDMNLRIVLRLLPTIREEDGLAMSSRNRYLDGGQREAAPEIHRVLLDSKAALFGGKKSRDVLAEGKARLGKSGFVVDYLALVQLPDMTETEKPFTDTALIVAARIGKTRLIDNVLLFDTDSV